MVRKSTETIRTPKTTMAKPPRGQTKKRSKKVTNLVTTNPARPTFKTLSTGDSKMKNRRTIVDVCIGIFTKNENKPMYVKNIYSAMRQRHWRTEGKTPQQTISSKLNADYRFVRVSPNTFKMDDSVYKNRVRTLNGIKLNKVK